MKINEIIIEARKNPDQNPKVSVNQAIADKIAKEDTEVFVSFTEIDKLGINPTSGYATPIGIYSYPATYVIRRVGERGGMYRLPFAGEQPYANLFTVSGNITDLADITDNNLIEYYKQLTDGYIKINGIQPGSSEWKTVVDSIEQIIASAPAHAKINTPAGKFWYVSRILADKSSKDSYVNSVVWNKLFRAAGFDGFVDHGRGIIHTSEENQAVFFSTGPIQNVERVYNKYSPDAFDDSIEIGELRMADEEEQMDIIDFRPDMIQYISNPSEDLQLVAVESDPGALGHIKNPTAAVIQAANNF